MAALGYCRLLEELETGNLERPIRDCLARSLRACRHENADKMITEAHSCRGTAENYANPLGLALARMHLGVALALNQDFEGALAELDKARRFFRTSRDSRQRCTKGLAIYLIGLVREHYRASLLAQIGSLDAKMVLYSQQSLRLLEHVLDHYAATDDQQEYRDLKNLVGSVPQRLALKLDLNESTAILKRVSIKSLPMPEKTALEASARACRNRELREMIRSARACLRYADACRDRNGRAAGLMYLALARFQAERYGAALTACDEAIRIYARDPHWPQRRSQAIATYAAARICGHHGITLTELAIQNETAKLNAYRRSISILQPLVIRFPSLAPICKEIRQCIAKTVESTTSQQAKKPRT
jgi:tetratricopeptide (TPR) repeat protein